MNRAVSAGAFSILHFNFLIISTIFRRLRNAKPQDADFVLNLDTLHVSDNAVEAELRNEEAEATFKFVLTSLHGNIFRVFIDEEKPLHSRYQVDGALNGELQVAKYSTTHIKTKRVFQCQFFIG